MSLSPWLEKLQRVDVAGFHLINGSFRNAFFDSLMPLITDKWNAALPLSLLFLYVLFFRPKRDRILIISAIAVVLIADATTQVLKTLFHRVRPCYVLENAVCYRSLTFHYGSKLLHAILLYAENLLQWSMVSAKFKGTVHYGGFSFPSNHATNVFALAAYFSYNYRKLTLPCFVAASLVGYSRIYLGAHYPMDILAGATLGVFIGFSAAVVAERLTGIRRADDPVQPQPPEGDGRPLLTPTSSL